MSERLIASFLTCSMIGFQFVPLLASAEVGSVDVSPIGSESSKESPPDPVETKTEKPDEAKKEEPEPEQKTEPEQKSEPLAEENSTKAETTGAGGSEGDIANAGETKAEDVVSTAGVTGIEKGDGNSEEKKSDTTAVSSQDMTEGSGEKTEIRQDPAGSGNPSEDPSTESVVSDVSPVNGPTGEAGTDVPTGDGTKILKDASIGGGATIIADSVTGKKVSSPDIVVSGSVPTLVADTASGNGSATILADVPTGDTTMTGPAIATGDASATGAVVTDLNADVSGGATKEVTNLSGQSTGDVNLLNDFLGLPGVTGQSTGSSSSDACSATPVASDQPVVVTNTVTASASTGDNTVTGSTGDASVTTGDAVAIAAAVNLVNLNLVGSGSRLAVINNFGEWTGDIIVPGQGLLSFGSGGSGLQVTANDGQAVVTGNVSSSADTGGNTAADAAGGASIVTGNAVSVAGSYTIMNTNLVGNAWFLFLFNNYGTWIGQVIDGDTPIGNSYSFPFGGSGDGSCGTGCGTSPSVSSHPPAVVTSDVSASASTGGNAISGVSGSASVTTGAATAHAGIFNLVNANIVGSNWLMGIFNNFGTWRGNLIFAYPDLTVSIDDGHDTAMPGDSLTYHVSIVNGGLAEADGVRFSLDLPEGFSGSADVPETLGPGESFSFDVPGTVGDLPSGTALVASASVKTDTVEKHRENKSASDDTTVFVAQKENVVATTTDDETSLRLKRSTESPSTIRDGGNVTYKIVVRNDGKKELSGVIVSDRISDPHGTELASFFWPVGTLGAGEGAIIEYSVNVPSGSDQGEYAASARASGDSDGKDVKSKKAFAGFTVLGGAVAYASEVPGSPADTSSDIPAGVMPEALGVMAESDRTLPIWMLLFSGVAYYLFINWSFFPNTHHYGKD